MFLLIPVLWSYRLREYLTIREVSDLLGLIRRTVAKYVQTGIIPAIRFTSKTTRIPKDWLNEALHKARAVGNNK